MQFKMNIKLSVTDTEVAEQENCLSIKHILNSIGNKAAWIFK